MINSYETINGLNLFKEDILKSFILHIPHSSTYIPSLDGFEMDKIDDNINQLTDWETDKIFDVNGIDKIITPFSRLFCDVERFADDDEPLVFVGRGFYYTHGFDNKPLRRLDIDTKNYIYNNYYLKHHQLFHDLVKSRIDDIGVCHIIDCHSFNDLPILANEYLGKTPDICIGIDEFHSPKYLIDYTLNYFKNIGYSVKINDPYSGCIIPKQYFKKNNNVKGIMIEINKKLYMDNLKINKTEVNNLKVIINNYFEML